MFCNCQATLGAHMRLAVISLKTISMVEWFSSDTLCCMEASREDEEQYLSELSHCQVRMMMQEKGKGIVCKGAMTMIDHNIQARWRRKRGYQRCEGQTRYKGVGERSDRKQPWEEKDNYYRQHGLRAMGEKQPTLDRTSQKTVSSGKIQVLMRPKIQGLLQEEVEERLSLLLTDHKLQRAEWRGFKR